MRGGDLIVTAKAFLEKVIIPYQESWGYIWGQWGAVWTEAKQKAATREMTIKYGDKWIGRRVTDCSGLLRWALNELGEKIKHHARYQYTDFCKKKGKLISGSREDGKTLLPGSAVFLKGSEPHIHHVGVYIGSGKCVEAKGTIDGVVLSDITHWDYWGELKMIDYSEAAELEGAPLPEKLKDPEPADVLRAVVNNPNQYLNVRSAPSSDSSRIFRLEKGSVVDVIDHSAGPGGWWQIKYGGRIGWAYSDYLQIIDYPQDPPAEEIQADALPPPNDHEMDGTDPEELIAMILDLRERLDQLSAHVDEITQIIFPEG